MKVSELTGAAIDWAVALIEFPEPDYENDDRLFPIPSTGPGLLYGAFK